MRVDQPKQPMRVFNARVSDATHRSVLERAKREDVPVSHMVRRMLIYALLNMPEYWVPPQRPVGGKR